MNCNGVLKDPRHWDKSNLGNIEIDLANCVFDNNYIIIEPLEATNLYKCIKKSTFEPFICKILLTKDYQNYLISYARLGDHPGINMIENILVGPEYTLIILASSFEDLHSYVRNKKRLKESEACALFYQITSIVAYCHKKGIVLRDLKLRKFVFKDAKRTQLKLETLDDCVVLSDPSNDQLSDRSKRCPAYVSPEILSPTQRSYSGKSADCWSLGIILFTMLVGRYPFYGDDPALIFAKIRDGNFNIPISTSSLAEFHIGNLLRKEPTERITAEDLIASRWFDSINPYIKNFENENSEDDDQNDFSGNERFNNEDRECKCISDQIVPSYFLESNTSSSLEIPHSSSALLH